MGVIGLGAMGRHHVAILEGLSALARVTAVADIDAAMVEAVAERTGARGYRVAEELIDAGDVDAVLVASPDHTHGALAQACVQRGLPVLCEKPLTTSLDEALAVAEAEDRAGRPLVQVGFMRRFDPDYRWMARQLPTAGDVQLFRSTHRNPVAGQRFDAHMLVLNSASHDIDLLRWLLPDEVAAVSCVAARPLDASAGAVLISLTTGRGAVGTVELAYGQGLAYQVACELVTTEGVIRLGSPSTMLRPLRSGAGAGAAPPQDFVERFDAAYTAQAVAWLGAVRSGEPVGATAWDGVVNVAVLQACAEALSSGGTVTVGIPQR